MLEPDADLRRPKMGKALSKPGSNVILTKSFVQNAEELVLNVSKAVVARPEVIRLSVASLLAGGHLLLNDLPGSGKTLLARSLALSLGASFKRIQFNPDLLPTDITGSSVFNRVESRFEFVEGPIFANVVLADEINRTSTRTQSALLEAMAEGQVTADGKSYPLPNPFWLVATQNDVDAFGTFPLPHAQLDRFTMSLKIGNPSEDEQVEILERNQQGDPLVAPILDSESIRDMQAQVLEVGIARPVREYLARILAATRNHPAITLGVGSRGGVHLQRSAQAVAAMQGDGFVGPEHIRAVAVAVMTHRIITVPEAATSSGEVIRELVDSVPVPI